MLCAVDVEDLAQEVMWPPPRHKLLNLCRNPKHTSVRKIASNSGPRARGKPSACLTLWVVVSDADLGSPSAWSVRCLRPIVAGPIPCDGVASCCIKVTGHLPADTPNCLFMAGALSALCFASDFLTLQSSLHACTGNEGFGERERWGLPVDIDDLLVAVFCARVHESGIWGHGLPPAVVCRVSAK